MRIHVEKDIYITSDERQFVIAKQTFQKDKETGEEKEVMLGLQYYTNLSSLIQALVRRKVSDSTATTLQELLTEVKLIKAHIESTVHI